MGEALNKRILQTQFESPLQEAMLNLLVAASHVQERMESICAQHAITTGQYNVLRILRGVSPEGYPRCEIIRRMLDRSPDVTRLVDRLEQQGLVSRDRSGEDRRMSVTKITEPGLKLLEQMQPSVEAVHSYFGERISLQDRRELSRICEGLYGQED